LKEGQSYRSQWRHLCSLGEVSHDTLYGPSQYEIRGQHSTPARARDRGSPPGDFALFKLRRYAVNSSNTGTPGSRDLITRHWDLAVTRSHVVIEPGTTSILSVQAKATRCYSALRVKIGTCSQSTTFALLGSCDLGVTSRDLMELRKLVAAPAIGFSEDKASLRTHDAVAPSLRRPGNGVHTSMLARSSRVAS
jgi:hypothetical protein